jgi:hypothetical protein
MPHRIMSESDHQIALWTPGWYELDQTLALGDRRKYWFFEDPPKECLSVAEDIDLVFFNQLDSAQNCSVRYAKIVDMMHPQLGKLLRVDTDGLDYIFFPVDGEEIVVNAEEEPGVVYDGKVSVDDWSIIVTLADVSEPVVVS